MSSTHTNDIQKAVLQQLSDTFTQIPFNRMLGLHLDHIDTTHVTMSFEMKDELIGNYHFKILHGGVISSVLDMAGGMVVMAASIQKKPEHSVEELADILSHCGTIDLQISYINPGKGNRFIAQAWLIKSGNKISFARMELHNQDNVLIATGNAVYSIT